MVIAKLLDADVHVTNYGGTPTRGGNCGVRGGSQYGVVMRCVSLGCGSVTEVALLDRRRR
jgi:hypothetical protein